MTQHETDAERAYRLLAALGEHLSQSSSEDLQADVNEYSEYAEGYGDGFLAGMRSMSWRYKLTTAIPYSIRSKYYALKRRLFPNDSDIPF